MLYRKVGSPSRASKLSSYTQTALSALLSLGLIAALASLSLSIAQAESNEVAEVYSGEYVVLRQPYQLNPARSSVSEYVGATLAEAPNGKQIAALVKSNMLGALSEGQSSDGIEVYNPAAHGAFCAALRKADPSVSSCEPNYVIRSSAVPNDTQYATLWGMDKISAPAAWDLTTGSRNVVVAVIDTGVDYNHPELAANMWHNPGEIAGNGRDDDNNGFVDDVYGANVISNTGNPMDDNSHGTHCAGTIGGLGNNELGVAGVNWNVSIMGVKFLSAGGAGSLYGAVLAINYAVASGAQIISASWGGGGYSQALYDAINNARAHGVLFVAAAGNSGLDTDTYPNYPSSYDLDNVIAVAAVGKNDVLASFSNFGDNSVDIAAPGVSILSTIPNGGYASYSGTSMATPHVAGVAALVKGYAPELNYAQLKARVLDGDALGTLQGLVAGGKRLNAYRALTSNAVPGSGSGNGGNDGLVNIDSLLGEGGTVYLSPGHAFNLELSGEAGSSSAVRIRFQVDGTMLGKCELGYATLGQTGKATVVGRLRLRGPARIAKSAEFKVSGDSAKRRLKVSNRPSGSSFSKHTLQRYINQSCELIANTVASTSF